MTTYDCASSKGERRCTGASSEESKSNEHAHGIRSGAGDVENYEKKIGSIVQWYPTVQFRQWCNDQGTDSKSRSKSGVVLVYKTFLKSTYPRMYTDTTKAAIKVEDSLKVRRTWGTPGAKNDDARGVIKVMAPSAAMIPHFFFAGQF
jgi:hypothetical protein